jgi:hypothetical protein
VSGPDGIRRLVVAAADLGTLPDNATWYLVTNLPPPGRPTRDGQPAPGGESGRDHPDLGHPSSHRANAGTRTPRRAEYSITIELA